MEKNYINYQSIVNKLVIGMTQPLFLLKYSSERWYLMYKIDEHSIKDLVYVKIKLVI